jgi:drug/metabolite transporter (DMT)-like permease
VSLPVFPFFSDRVQYAKTVGSAQPGPAPKLPSPDRSETDLASMTDPQTAAAPAARLSGSLRGALYMIGAGASFAAMIVIVRHLSAELHPFEIAFFRNLLGTVFMLPWVIRTGWGGLRTERIGLHMVRSLVGLAAMLCLFSAISLMPVAEVTALTFSAPLFATAGAALVLGETVRLRRWTATAIGFVGALIILRPGSEAMTPAALVALASAAFMAVALLTVKALSRTENPNAIVLYMGLMLTPLSLVPALFVWTAPAAGAWPWLVAMGLTATVGQVLMTRAFAAAEASAVLPFDFSRLVFVAVLGFALFGERPDLWTWIGAAVIVAATAYNAHRESRLGGETPPPTP